ncbi:MAG TPA: symmetrical bis(5'-nucleosyl)-tetraphosphatase [Gammaproteobacteria bacterium]|nr:symmetrical bis(5'-nucleosyl)-tetraphosphatase [Gammaproteobacteria bacterium]
MATYAIGDIQGCFDELCTLLERFHFDPQRDRLWFAGDLVNRGPQSTDTLRFVKELGSAAVTVLGNHELHLLAIAAGVTEPRPLDTFLDVLEAPDADHLLHWLRHQPLIHCDARQGFTLLHAGLPPQWDLATARARAAEVEGVLRGPDHESFFRHMYGNGPNRWSPDLDKWARLRFITNCFTRLRLCSTEGELALEHKGAPDRKNQRFMPWFEVPGRKSAGNKILFGHWSTLGRHVSNQAYCLDSGCVWGGKLSALRLEDESWFDTDCEGA